VQAPDISAIGNSRSPSGFSWEPAQCDASLTVFERTALGRAVCDLMTFHVSFVPRNRPFFTDPFVTPSVRSESSSSPAFSFPFLLPVPVHALSAANLETNHVRSVHSGLLPLRLLILASSLFPPQVPQVVADPDILTSRPPAS